MYRRWAGLRVRATATVASLPRQESLLGDRREHVVGCKSTLSLITRRRLLPCQRGDSRRHARGQLRAAEFHRSRALGPMF